MSGTEGQLIPLERLIVDDASGICYQRHERTDARRHSETARGTVLRGVGFTVDDEQIAGHFSFTRKLEDWLDPA